jgi:hypothetical protein
VSYLPQIFITPLINVQLKLVGISSSQLVLAPDEEIPTKEIAHSTIQTARVGNMNASALQNYLFFLPRQYIGLLHTLPKPFPNRLVNDLCPNIPHNGITGNKTKAN